MAVLPLIFLGKSNDEIGQILCISPRAIKNHVQGLLRKLNATNRIAACYQAIRKGYLDPPDLEPPAPPRAKQYAPVNKAPEPEPLPPSKWISHRGIRLCWESMEAEIDGKPLELQRSHFRLLHFFILNPHRTHSRQTLLDYVHSQDRAHEERTIDVHIRRLRVLLEPYGYGGLILTIRCVGYRLEAE